MRLSPEFHPGNNPEICSALSDMTRTLIVVSMWNSPELMAVRLEVILQLPVTAVVPERSVNAHRPPITTIYGYHWKQTIQ
jgi:hypothetical protein